MLFEGSGHGEGLEGWFGTDEGTVIVDVDVNVGKETDFIALSTTPVLSDCCWARL